MEKQNPFRTTLKPWLKPKHLLVFTGESNHSVGFLLCEVDFATIHSTTAGFCQLEQVSLETLRAFRFLLYGEWRAPKRGPFTSRGTSMSRDGCSEELPN